MPVATVRCALCNKEAALDEMHSFGTATLGHYADPALAFKFFCPDPCFKRLRDSQRIRKHFEAWQDACGRWARASLESLTDAELEAMEGLPEGLRVTAEERERFNELRDHLGDVRKLQSREDNWLLHKVCRVRNRNPYFNPYTREFVDFDALKENLRALETLTPEQREALCESTRAARRETHAPK